MTDNHIEFRSDAGEGVRKMVCSKNRENSESLGENLLTNKVNVQLHVLGTGVQDRVMRETARRKSHTSTGSLNGTPSSMSIDWIQRTFAVILAMILYLASVLDLATSCCFLEHQEMRLGPI